MGKRRQKPYYFVAEEEYRLLQQICGHYLPAEELTLLNLRSLVSSLPKTPQASDCSPTVAIDPRTTQQEDETATEDAVVPRNDVLLPEIVDLHETLGCMFVDPLGEYSKMTPKTTW